MAFLTCIAVVTLILSLVEVNEFLRYNCCKLNLFRLCTRRFPITRKILGIPTLLYLGVTSILINTILLAVVPQALSATTRGAYRFLAGPGDSSKTSNGVEAVSSLEHAVLWTLLGLGVLLLAKGELCFNYKWRRQRYKEERRRSTDRAQVESSRDIVSKLTQNSLGIVGRLPIFRSVREMVQLCYDSLFAKRFDDGLRKLVVNAVILDIAAMYSEWRIAAAFHSARYQDAVGGSIDIGSTEPLIMLDLMLALEDYSAPTLIKAIGLHGERRLEGRETDDGETPVRLVLAGQVITGQLTNRSNRGLCAKVDHDLDVGDVVQFGERSYQVMHKRALSKRLSVGLQVANDN